jgi:hypothetical protein
MTTGTSTDNVDAVCTAITFSFLHQRSHVARFLVLALIFWPVALVALF